MRVQYGINRAVKVGRKKTIEHSQGVLTVSGSPKDVGWSAKIKGLIYSKHPGWNITGWAEIAVVTSQEQLLAFEAGYRACEKGDNLQMALDKFVKFNSG